MVPDTLRKFISLNAVAQRYGRRHEWAKALVDAGELRAVNLAVDPRGKRPRLFVHVDEIERFERARSTTPVPEPTRRPRRTRSDDDVSYF
jgi:hypothetical protein